LSVREDIGTPGLGNAGCERLPSRVTLVSLVYTHDAETATVMGSIFSFRSGSTATRWRFELANFSPIQLEGVGAKA
jgi:hypothetical protein